MFVELKNNETVQEYLEPGKVSVIKFATTTCPPCKMLKPIFEKLGKEDEEMKDVIFIAADANEHPQAYQYQVSSVPTILFYKGEEVLGQNVGFVPEKALKDFIKKTQSEMAQA